MRCGNNNHAHNVDTVKEHFFSNGIDWSYAWLWHGENVSCPTSRTCFEIKYVGFSDDVKNDYMVWMVNDAENDFVGRPE